MKKNSKKPEERRQELIDTAYRLFQEKGYEAVSVRDILEEVHGAPGMFYYYFKSKQEIYMAAVSQYIEQGLERKKEALADPSVPFAEKKKLVNRMMEEDFAGYLKDFDPEEDKDVTTVSYKLWEFVQMLDKMQPVYAEFILQGIREGVISDELGITEENVKQYALFALYGSWGLLYNSHFSEDKDKYEMRDALKVIAQLFHSV